MADDGTWEEDGHTYWKDDDGNVFYWDDEQNDWVAWEGDEEGEIEKAEDGTWTDADGNTFFEDEEGTKFIFNHETEDWEQWGEEADSIVAEAALPEPSPEPAEPAPEPTPEAAPEPVAEPAPEPVAVAVPVKEEVKKAESTKVVEKVSSAKATKADDRSGGGRAAAGVSSPRKASLSKSGTSTPRLSRASSKAKQQGRFTSSPKTSLRSASSVNDGSDGGTAPRKKKKTKKATIADEVRSTTKDAERVAELLAEFRPGATDVPCATWVDEGGHVFQCDATGEVHRYDAKLGRWVVVRRFNPSDSTTDFGDFAPRSRHQRKFGSRSRPRTRAATTKSRRARSRSRRWAREHDDCAYHDGHASPTTSRRRFDKGGRMDAVAEATAAVRQKTFGDSATARSQSTRSHRSSQSHRSSKRSQRTARSQKTSTSRAADTSSGTAARVAHVAEAMEHPATSKRSTERAVVATGDRAVSPLPSTGALDTTGGKFAKSSEGQPTRDGDGGDGTVHVHSFATLAEATEFFDTVTGDRRGSKGDGKGANNVEQVVERKASDSKASSVTSSNARRGVRTKKKKTGEKRRLLEEAEQRRQDNMARIVRMQYKQDMEQVCAVSSAQSRVIEQLCKQNAETIRSTQSLLSQLTVQQDKEQQQQQQQQRWAQQHGEHAQPLHHVAGVASSSSLFPPAVHIASPGHSASAMGKLYSASSSGVGGHPHAVWGAPAQGDGRTLQGHVADVSTLASLHDISATADDPALTGTPRPRGMGQAASGPLAQDPHWDGGRLAQSTSSMSLLPMSRSGSANGVTERDGANRSVTTILGHAADVIKENARLQQQNSYQRQQMDAVYMAGMQAHEQQAHQQHVLLAQATMASASRVGGGGGLWRGGSSLSDSDDDYDSLESDSDSSDSDEDGQRRSKKSKKKKKKKKKVEKKAKEERSKDNAKKADKGKKAKKKQGKKGVDDDESDDSYDSDGYDKDGESDDSDDERKDRRRSKSKHMKSSSRGASAASDRSRRSVRSSRSSRSSKSRSRKQSAWDGMAMQPQSSRTWGSLPMQSATHASPPAMYPMGMGPMASALDAAGMRPSVYGGGMAQPGMGMYGSSQPQISYGRSPVSSGGVHSTPGLHMGYGGMNNGMAPYGSPSQAAWC